MTDIIIRRKPRKSPSAPQQAVLHPSDFEWLLSVSGKKLKWRTPLQRVALIRRGLSFEAIESISSLANRPVKTVLNWLHLPQTTYNKKKSEGAKLDTHASEWVLCLAELLQYGSQVFNAETEKFDRWLGKTNVSLGGQVPEQLFDTISGMEEVRTCLHRINYGNFA
jgi:putative toxin-antitoxin system antitoxin component (TIGR02293 family)